VMNLLVGGASVPGGSDIGLRNTPAAFAYLSGDAKQRPQLVSERRPCERSLAQLRIADALGSRAVDSARGAVGTSGTLLALTISEEIPPSVDQIRPVGTGVDGPRRNRAGHVLLRGCRPPPPGIGSRRIPERAHGGDPPRAARSLRPGLSLELP